MRPLDLKGKKYGRLKAIRPTNERRDAKIVWEFLCDCGKKHFAIARDVKNGHSKSCGCFSVDALIKRSTTHGKRHTPEWSTWNEMMNRAHRYNCDKRFYKDRGIKVCKRWLKFENFLKDMGEKPKSKMSLDRINNNGDYKPSNCRWATQKEQCNNRRSNVYLLFKGKKLTIAQWSDETGISYRVIHNRIFTLNWPTDKALTQPVRKLKICRSIRETKELDSSEK